MKISRMFRVPGTLATAAVLALAGCSSSSSPPAGAPAPAVPEPSTGDIGGTTAEPLRPLPANVPSTLTSYYRQKLTWRHCGTGFQCATLKVPLDYDEPTKGRDLKLAVSRKRATGRAKHLGSLLVNPGGPGGSAIDYLQQYAATSYPAPVRAHYDMVAVDPRGVGRSEPVSCLTDRQMDDYVGVDQTPDDTTEVNRLVAAYKNFARGCARRSGDVLQHVSTVESARDMDVLRQLLGDRELNYVGASYGTYLGATYAGLFPKRVGRLVLDGAMDPSLSSERVNLEQTRGFETAFTAFAKDCVRRKDCPLGRGSVSHAGTRLTKLFQRLDSHPLPTGSSRKLGESLATTGVISAMYDEGAWPQLRSAVRAAQHGEGAPLLQLADSYYERDDSGSYQNLMYANSAVNCVDLPPAFRTPADVRAALPAFRKASPTFGEGLAWAALNCAYWKVPATGAPHRIEARGSAPIVVVGTVRDPATPYPWARGLAAQLRSGTLLTYDGDGHTAYGRGSGCVDAAINTYLLDGKPPAAGTKCS